MKDIGEKYDMKATTSLSRFQLLCTIFRQELRKIFTDEGVLLILVFATLIYATLYSATYGAQVLRNIPIGVIDESHTVSSRRLITLLDAGPNIHVAYEPTDMPTARELFFQREIYGIVYIPANYERQLLDNVQTCIAIYCDASNFLMYRQVFQDLVTSINLTGAQVELQRLVTRNTDIRQAQATIQPVVYQSHNLFNPYLGYGTFVMPAVLMVIIQQTLLIGIGMLGGTWYEQNRQPIKQPYSNLITRSDTIPFIVLGRFLAHALIYTITTSYILGVHYRLFDYPDNGSTLAVIVFAAFYLTACILFALAVSTLFRHREDSLILLLWTSIPILMLSGVSFPREGMPQWLYAIGQLFPSSHGIDGLIRIRSMGASLNEVFPEIKALLTLAFLFGIMACISTYRTIQRKYSIRK